MKISNNHVVIFFISFFCILLELFLTRVLNLKAWNHVVYTVIPFAILGYGIGANIVLLCYNKISQWPKTYVIAGVLLLTSVLTLFTITSLIYIPISIDAIVNIFTSTKAFRMLLAAYTIFMIPFILIGFLVVYLFSCDPQDSPRLYFFDLIGAGLGAALFIPLINTLAVYHSLLLLALIGIFLAFTLLAPKMKWINCVLFVITLFFSHQFIAEPLHYTIDKKKGWEWIPGHFKASQYEQVVSRWHALGRTNIYRITDPKTRKDIVALSPGTFQINVFPPPEYAYISTNFLAGTPVYNLSKEGLAKQNSKIQLFSQSMEVPYILLDKPKVLVIGAGGGRDLFMAKTHGAVEIIGAEINPGIVKEMSPGGSMYDYSGKVYTMENTKVHLIDGRHLVKNLTPNDLDLIVLNGVDTFSGLSSGDYAYAESYLYTKNAVIDYLRVLNDDGMINFNRWLFPSMPRETLRLHAIALEALEDIGAENPWDHIIIGGVGWSFMLIKKTPFTDEERRNVFNYFIKHGIYPLYPNGVFSAQKGHPLNTFTYYAEDFKEKLTDAWKIFYSYDISVITDDNPFFYKYYKLKYFNPFRSYAVHHTGTVIFLTQTVILLQAIIFIGLFIGLPLLIFKKKEIKNLPAGCIQPFIIYFSCLGCGFMFIEIPIMQRFVLLLGSPIYSIAVVLSVLLISTGIGSLALKSLQSFFKSNYYLLSVMTIGLMVYLLTLVGLGTTIYDQFMIFAFPVRVLLVSSLLFPLGFCLGVFFPLGLQLVSSRYPNTIPWAWGINCGFSVLGSILSIILAQFIGFNAIIMLALVTYLIAFLSFSKMTKILGE